MLREGWQDGCGCGLANFDATPGPQEDLSSVGTGLGSALWCLPLGTSLEWRNARKREGKGPGALLSGIGAVRR